MTEFLSLLKSKPHVSAPKVLIYSKIQSPRLSHTCAFVFEQVLKVNCEITCNESVFNEFEGIKINYSNANLIGGLQIIPNALIFENDIQKHQFQFHNNNKKVVLYQINNSNNLETELDLFSAVFFFISRYEEWQTFEADQHGRFEAQSSILFKNKLHLQPIVDIWINEFENKLQIVYPNQKWPETSFHVISTIDVDNVYAFQSKALIRTIGGFAKDLVRLDFFNFQERFKTIFLGKRDPFDVYEELSQFCQSNSIPLIYFFLFRSGNQYDRTLNPNSSAFKKVFERIKNYNAQIGLHPSYGAAYHNELFVKEKIELEQRSQTKINFSRQHFLRFNVKETPQNLINQGILADFTMGFASSIGFRAGTSYPFNYYDFNLEKSTNLIMVPFCAMDGAFTVYQKVNANQAFENLMSMANEIKRVGGYFISVYHERSFYNHLYKDYGDLYKKLHLHLK